MRPALTVWLSGCVAGWLAGWLQDADHPVTTSLKRLFLFEVEQMAEAGGVTMSPQLHLFQALSPADMDGWKVQNTCAHTRRPALLDLARSLALAAVRIIRCGSGADHYRATAAPPPRPPPSCCSCGLQRAFDQVMVTLVTSPSTGGDPSISVPIHLKPVRQTNAHDRTLSFLSPPHLAARAFLYLDW